MQKGQNIGIELFRQLSTPSPRPGAVDAAQAAAVPTPAPAAPVAEQRQLHPELQKMLDNLTSPEYRDSQNLAELEAVCDRRLLWEIIPVRDAIEREGIQIYIAPNIAPALRQRLGMPTRTAAAADAHNRRIIIDMEGIERGAALLNLSSRRVLVASLLHEAGHILLGHSGSDRLPQLNRIGRERMAWAYAELLCDQNKLWSFIQPNELKRLEEFAINTHVVAD